MNCSCRNDDNNDRTKSLIWTQGRRRISSSSFFVICYVKLKFNIRMYVFFFSIRIEMNL